MSMSFINYLWAPITLTSNINKDVFNIIETIPIFSSLDRIELLYVAKILHTRTYRADEIVFKEGEAGNGMYIIQSGAITISGTDSKKNEVLYTSLHKCDFFGELSLVDGSPRSATAKGSGPTVLLGFFKPDLIDIIEKSPRIGSKVLLNLASVLGERLRKMNQLNLDLTTPEAYSNG